MSDSTINNSEIIPNEQLFSVFGRRRGKFFMKLFYYEGLMLFLPYIILSYFSHLEFDSTIPQSLFIVVMLGVSVVCLFIMDLIGIQSRILDRYCRFITLSFAILGICGALLLIIFSWEEFDIYNWGIALGTVLTFMAFFGFGWYFVRADRGIVVKNEGPYFKSTVYALGLGSVGFLLELIIPRGLLIGVCGSFIVFIAIMRYELVSVKPKVKLRNIIKPFRRVTAWNFLIDMIKLGSIILTILALSYNAEYILYPKGPNLIDQQWVLNLFIMGLSATLAMLLYNKIKDKIFGLLVIILIFIINIIMTIIIWAFPAVPWAIIAIMNGFTLSGLYYFIEQKMDLSSNIRAMPGSFMILIFFLFGSAIILRTVPELSRYLTNLGPIVCALGLAYLFGILKNFHPISTEESLKVDWAPGPNK